MNRPVFRECRVFVAALLVSICHAQTGRAVPALAALDDTMEQALAIYSVKGGALAVVKDGRLIFARGYGLSDAEAGDAVQPAALFRWASISKTVTAAAVMRLVEDGKLDLDSPIFGILNQYSPYNGRWGDSRVLGITVRQVLHHTGGWDRDESGDVTCGDKAVTVSQATGTAFPPSQEAIVRYMLSQPLDFAPDTRFAYSNFGYLLLGRVIEKISGQSYNDFVRSTVLDRLSLARVQRGNSSLAGRLRGEVKYYDYPGAPLLNSYVSPSRELVPAPYGILDFNQADSYGGWVGSVVDLVKFASMLDGMRPHALLTADSMTAMLGQTSKETWVDPGTWYGFGVFVQPQLGGVTWSNAGATRGMHAQFARFANGLLFAWLFNGDSQDQTSLISFVNSHVWNTLSDFTEWPDNDLFPEFYPDQGRAPGRRR